MVKNTTSARIMEILGACILCIIFIAGLWPFHAPKNQVKWLENKSGLGFDRFGSVLSSGSFHCQALHDDSAGSLEVWLQASYLRSKRTILSFDGSDHPGAPFSLFQYNDALMVYRYNVDDYGTARTAWFVVNGVFREKKTVFVTITIGKQDTSVYLDGVLAKIAPIHGISINNISGRLVLANSPSVNDSWCGEIMGLAIYQRQLSSVQVAKHYESWKRNHRPALGQDESPLALYLFNEGQGTVVRNEIDPATRLTIPQRYFVLHPRFLASPLDEYRPTWSYWKDVAINIAGFIPLGAWAIAYFCSVKVVNRPAILAISAGFVASLVIEVSQAFLPTRSSGMTDLTTNTLGTAIGVMLCRRFVMHGWERARQHGNHAATTHPELEEVLSA